MKINSLGQIIVGGLIIVCVTVLMAIGRVEPSVGMTFVGLGAGWAFRDAAVARNEDIAPAKKITTMFKTPDGVQHSITSQKE